MYHTRTHHDHMDHSVNLKVWTPGLLALLNFSSNFEESEILKISDRPQEGASGFCCNFNYTTSHFLSCCCSKSAYHLHGKPRAQLIVDRPPSIDSIVWISYYGSHTLNGITGELHLAGTFDSPWPVNIIQLDNIQSHRGCWASWTGVDQ